MTSSPLRYPGGKARLFKEISSILERNKLSSISYAEPYAGGAGLALELLFNGYAETIAINDADPAVYSFWNILLNDTDSLLSFVRSCKLSVDEWKNQRMLLRSSLDPKVLGLAFFYLNRTSRSGIVGNSGVIGGLKQNTQYKIDCRFNRSALERRISRIARRRASISVSNDDALSFITAFDASDHTCKFFYIDPPYFRKGATLYRNSYCPEDHASVCEVIKNLSSPWVLTYDHEDEILKLYRWAKAAEFDLQYSLQNKRVAKEYMFFSSGLRVYREDLGVRYARVD